MGQSTSAEDAIAIALAIASDKVNSYRFLLKLLKKFPRDEWETDLKPFVVRYGAFAIPAHNGEEMELLTFLSST